MVITKAHKSKAKLRLGIAGPSGAGKTYSALLLASGLADWQKIVVIDTENSSAALYSDLGGYSTLVLERPYTPERYIEAIQQCEKSGFEVIIIDSISHEWEGAGGILEIHGQMTGNSFINWSKLTPRHRALIDKILSSSGHIIATIRKKQEYAMIVESNKTKVEKMGTKDIQREGMSYEMTIHFDLEMNHLATSTKDRSRLFMDKPPFLIDVATGKNLKKWLNAESDYSCDRCRLKEKKDTPVKPEQYRRTKEEWKAGLCIACEKLAKKSKS